jgi:hypothetical protein
MTLILRIGNTSESMGKESVLKKFDNSIRKKLTTKGNEV